MPGILGKYQIHRTLGQGASCKVKLGQEIETGKKVAIKIMSQNIDEKVKKLILTEVSAMSILKHDHIVSQIDYGQDVYIKDSGKVRTVSFIVLELASGGEIFDYIANSGKFNENLARYYFHQFMSGLKHCHDQGVAHRDLKPENLLLDENFNLKIADFGFAAPVQGRDGSGELHTKLGTMNYMAPEIHLK